MNISDVKEFPAVYGTWRLMSVFTRAHYRPLPWVSWHRVHKLISYFCKINDNNIVLPSVLPSRCAAKIAYSLKPVCATCPADLNIHLIAIIILSAEHIKSVATCYVSLGRYSDDVSLVSAPETLNTTVTICTTCYNCRNYAILSIAYSYVLRDSQNKQRLFP